MRAYSHGLLTWTATRRIEPYEPTINDVRIPLPGALLSCYHGDAVAVAVDTGAGDAVAVDTAVGDAVAVAVGMGDGVGLSC